MTTEKKDPHANCPPAVWDGIQWVCNNHGVPEVVPRTREAFATSGRPGGKAPVPRPARDTELAAEVAALGGRLAAAEAAIDGLTKREATGKGPKAKAR